MIGKKNIVFGFLYLAFCAALGPVMIINHFPDVGTAEASKQKAVGILQQVAQDGFEMDLEPMTADNIARTNTQAILAISARLNAQVPIDAIKGGPHAHGNLEALLNIAVGLLLCFLAIHRNLKQLISWVFIVGTVMHSGLLYLSVALEFPWAVSLMAGPVAYIGPVLILTGLVLAGLAAAVGFRGMVENDF
ncbi:MAG: hypothetical protein BMS9Abin36_2061 [Gammaproteobacteria bacterium]|nr:MAG: hypothetical protein BMS9Abin36_2061 [Gammaproteobacteria bacterium]